MPYVFIYLLKLSISLSIVFLFYQLVLRKLTFYTWNRWYLLGYSALSFLIACYNITPLFQSKLASYKEAIRLVPALNFDHPDIVRRSISATSETNTLEFWNWIELAIVVGIVVLSTRLLIQYVSFLRIRRHAQILSTTNTRIYHVESDIIPFSFGNSIFINQELHSKDELQEIVRHEFVHVKQRHSIDILWSEFICIINWYNPFCWLLKKAIRENLEFIADNNVLANGTNRKEYQYLLLKVIGNKHFSIAPNFNFSSLKKRIAMMNKMKTARVHVIKFLFVLPVAVLSLIAFRTKDFRATISLSSQTAPNQRSAALISISDTTPPKTVKKPTRSVHTDYKIEISDGQAEVKLSDGRSEKYDLNDSMEKSDFESKYGKVISITPVPATNAIAIVGSAGETVSVSSSPVVATIVAPTEETVGVTSKVSTISKTIISAKAATGTTISPVAADDDVMVIDENGNNIPHEEHDIATIGKSTTAQQIDDLKKQLASQGYELTIDNSSYNSKGILTHVDGRIKSKDSMNKFSATDFEKVVITLVTVKNTSYIRVLIKDRPKQII